MWASCVVPHYESYRSGASLRFQPQLLASFLPTTPISSLHPSHPQRFLFPHLFQNMAVQIALWNSLVEKVRLSLFPSSLSLSLPKKKNTPKKPHQKKTPKTPSEDVFAFIVDYFTERV